MSGIQGAPHTVVEEFLVASINVRLDRSIYWNSKPATGVGAPNITLFYPQKARPKDNGQESLISQHFMGLN